MRGSAVGLTILLASSRRSSSGTDGLDGRVWCDNQLRASDPEALSGMILDKYADKMGRKHSSVWTKTMRLTALFFLKELWAEMVELS